MTQRRLACNVNSDANANRPACRAGTQVEGILMDATVVDVAQAVEGFSFLALFLRADWVVKGVMCILAFMSVWSWAIAIDKSLQLRSLHAKARNFEREFWSGRSLDALADQFAKNAREPFSRVFAAGLREWKGAHPGSRPIPRAVSACSRPSHHRRLSLVCSALSGAS